MCEVEYVHIELPTHDILLAEGLPAESYLDTGHRTTLMPGVAMARQAPSGAAEARVARSCAPVATDAARVEPIWRRIARAAAEPAQAVPTTADPDLRLLHRGGCFGRSWWRARGMCSPCPAAARHGWYRAPPARAICGHGSTIAAGLASASAVSSAMARSRWRSRSIIRDCGRAVGRWLRRSRALDRRQRRTAGPAGDEPDRGDDASTRLLSPGSSSGRVRARSPAEDFQPGVRDHAPRGAGKARRSRSHYLLRHAHAGTVPACGDSKNHTAALLVCRP